MGNCHCRKTKKKLPTEGNMPNESNLSSWVNYKESLRWMNSTAPMRDALNFHKLSLAVTLYCWSLIVAGVYAIIITHIFPIMGDPWYTCRQKNLASGSDVTCILLLHFVDVPVVVQALGTAIYGLRYYNRARQEIFEKVIQWNNTVFVGMIAFEVSSLYHGYFIADASTAQQASIFSVVVLLTVGIGFGLYCNYRSYISRKPIADPRYVYPKTEADLVSLVKEAYFTKTKLRVRGSEHSLKLGIYIDDEEAQGDATFGVTVSLDDYIGIVDIDKEHKRITFKAGTILGKEETNPKSEWSNGICKQIDDLGWALGDTGGVVKQTIAGFISMGCAGGSVQHDFFDSLYQVRMIDGRGQIREYTRPDDDNPNDPFFGVIASFGLCGVISTVTLQCVDRYNAIGSQFSLGMAEWATHKDGPKEDGDGTGPLDLFADNSDPKSVYNLIMSEDNRTYKCEYIRFFWWPQIKENSIVMWKAHREDERDQKTEEWKPLYKKGVLSPRPYVEIGTASTTVLLQKIVSVLYNFFDLLVSRKTQEIPDWLIPIVQLIIKVSNEDTKEPMIFGDSWYKILPMDQGIKDNLMPFQFTELWVDINDADKALRALQKYFEDDTNFNRKGLFGWELYPAQGCKEWMRPGYCPPDDKRTWFRIDALWFDVNYKAPYPLWNPLWEFLIEQGIHFRAHWGKWMPFGNQAFPNESYKTWADYYKAQYPKWNDFLKLRQSCDPENIFLTQYWAQQLGITADVEVVPQ